MNDIHQLYMKRCFELALQGAGKVSPNPMVGSVLVYENRIIGEGFHQQAGSPHAEVNCIQSVAVADQVLIPKSTIYVSLEPCCHQGRTPACTSLILQYGIKKVVVACRDYASHVNGQGIALLKAHGVEVIENILQEEAEQLNCRFFTFHLQQRPYIILKWAQSKEGFIGVHQERKFLSNPLTNKRVHQWRSEEDAVWVGFQTVLTDNPSLNVRLVNGRQPIRMVYDRSGELSPDLKLLDHTQTTFIFNHERNEHENGLHYIQIERDQVMNQILNYLFEKEVLSVLVEGGQRLLQSFINADLWDEARCIQTDTSLDTGVKAPVLKGEIETARLQLGSDTLIYYKKK